jgi:hypothetical protein
LKATKVLVSWKLSTRIYLIVYSALAELGDYQNVRLKPNVLFILSKCLFWRLASPKAL